MQKYLKSIGLFLVSVSCFSQNRIPIDTMHWDIKAKSYVIENYKGKKAIYLQAGSMTLKDSVFLNGTIEFDIYLKETPAFPGVYFRAGGFNGEQWYMRPHLSGKPDANQAAPIINGISPWQLCFGPKYSFPYHYKYDNWTHVKLVVKDDKAQVFLDYSEEPNLSWKLFLPAKGGEIILRGGNLEAFHIADIKINRKEAKLINYKPVERKPIEGLVPEWELSDMFERKLLDNPLNIPDVIKKRSWGRKIQVEEGTAANISRQQRLFNGEPGETVFAKIVIHSEVDQMKLFHFGYSDDVVAILNGTPIYRGTNKWRSRDYRYLGTIGLFDAIYLNLKKGKNELLMAVSENFGGWLITGKFDTTDGISIAK
ncbi:hypothetical protein [Seonamhaeicola sp.]|uniref:hypothetical protein n=1 Tax=Seonamhaeicola sp. TaxID=1912245 RepID=UPI00262D02EC|nr:hypothetical protein [Seonamhaeicola sp.]